mgnify:CR=1 FL=1
MWYIKLSHHHLSSHHSGCSRCGNGVAFFCVLDRFSVNVIIVQCRNYGSVEVWAGDCIRWWTYPPMLLHVASCCNVACWVAVNGETNLQKIRWYHFWSQGAPPPQVSSVLIRFQLGGPGGGSRTPPGPPTYQTLTCCLAEAISTRTVVEKVTKKTGTSFSDTGHPISGALSRVSSWNWSYIQVVAKN